MKGSPCHRTRLLFHLTCSAAQILSLDGIRGDSELSSITICRRCCMIHEGNWVSPKLTPIALGVDIRTAVRVETAQPFEAILL